MRPTIPHAAGRQSSFLGAVAVVELEREASLGGAIALCARVAGLTGSEVAALLKSDKAQLSRWISGGEGVTWPKLCKLMDAAGNEAPLFWMLMARGYDAASVRPLQSAMDRKLRDAEQRVVQLEMACVALARMAGVQGLR